MLSYMAKCWNYLKEHGFITAWTIHVVTGTTCPHSVIRDIRKKYGYDILTHKDVKKTRTYTENGKQRRETKTYRIWYLNNGSGCNSVTQSAEQ